MSTEIQPPAQPTDSPRRHTDAFAEGQDDAFDEPHWVLEDRIRQARDHATANDDPRARHWADDYAAGVHATWRALDTLQTALDTLGAQ